MRPDLLNPLFSSVTSLPGIGPRLVKRLAKLLDTGSAIEAQEPHVADLLWHFPVSVIDRSYRPRIAEITQDVMATLELEIDRHEPPPSRASRRPYRIYAHDDTGQIVLIFFHGHRDYLQKQLPEGETRYVSGKVDFGDGAPRMIHPDYLLSAADFNSMPLIEPIYPMTAGLAGKTLAKAVLEAVKRCPPFSEWQDPAWLGQQKWPSFNEALEAVHHPQTLSDVDPSAAHRSRIAYDELLANQLALGLVRAHMHKASGQVIAGDGSARDKIIAALPFTLTASQEYAMQDIAKDMAEPARMLRLLQGDVGSGKTIIALLAMAIACEAGFQAAIMAPTEILARQHLASLAPLCKTAGLRIALLTGREKGAVRRSLLTELEAGDIDILVGTHALFQEGVEFKHLALAVIDEQHRFGVHQRLALQAKGPRGVDVLVMTATPIPRTLTLTLYGDMDVSKLTEKPAGRQPVETRVLPVQKLEQVIQGLKRAIEDAARVYWICPLVEASEEIDAVSAQDRFEILGKFFPNRVGLVHGRMAGLDKDQVMERFASGDIDILVATTVVEVGVDVPEASIMVIEHAERFGLSQLHQLRGRVGRGAKQSSCVLLYKAPLSDTAQARLKIMRETEDGFIIAEEDLRLRGGGEVLGARQSGLPGFKSVSLDVHGRLLAAAHDDSRLLLVKDPMLQSERGLALKILLYLFERDDAVRLLQAG